GVILEVLLQQVAVVARVFVTFVERERAVVLVDRRRQLPGLRQRVAAIVVPLRRVDGRERRRALLEPAGTILRGATPLGILEQLRGALGLLALERLLAALVGPLPEVLPLERFGARLRRQNHEQPQRNPAAAEAQREQRQQDHGEDDAAVEPDVRFVLLAGSVVERSAERQRGGRKQRVEIAVARRERGVAAAARGRESLQAGDVDLGHDDLTAVVSDEAALAARDRSALLRADGQHADAVTVAEELARGVE